MNCTRCMSTTCMTQDCIIFLRNVNKIITLLEELKSKLQSKITNSRMNREHIAIKYAKGVISSHLESTSEIQDQLIILQGFLKKNLALDVGLFYVLFIRHILKNLKLYIKYIGQC